MNPFLESTVALPLSASKGGTAETWQEERSHCADSPPRIALSGCGPGLPGAVPPVGNGAQPTENAPQQDPFAKRRLFYRTVAPWRMNGMRRPRRALARVLGLAAALGLAGHMLAAGAAPAINVNAATETQLRSVRGIGPKTARLIIDERARGGKYESIDDLATRVKGIGQKKAATLKAGGLVVQDGGGASQ